ncbi:uncharacterized protein LOC116258640 isoform X6 [Nymphaea colorata]|uniref:uncharacterized protein LOC116258640 isoform X6 n=1 Tax=Nymphaea colorata TaxID=210225 RepID=UPI00214E19C3|nr:uncharacterized protein LOC116258640 isoform X6 [Nymphaea colorata]
MAIPFSLAASVLLLILSLSPSSSSSSSMLAQGATSRRQLRTFKELRGNTTFECFPSGPCVACHYSEKDLQTGKMIGGGHEHEGLYFLSVPVDVAASSFTSKPSPLQWHLRLGHPSVSKFRRIFSDISASKSFLCDACHLGKHTRSSFPSSQSPSSQSPFDLFYVDVWFQVKFSFVHASDITLFWLMISLESIGYFCYGTGLKSFVSFKNLSMI